MISEIYLISFPLYSVISPLSQVCQPITVSAGYWPLVSGVDSHVGWLNPYLQSMPIPTFGGPPEAIAKFCYN